MNGTEKLIITDEFIKIEGTNKYTSVMHIGETSIMQKYAEIVTQNGGDILEIGFGMGLSATAIQSNPNVKSHTIIEAHPEIYQRAISWSKDRPNVKIILGDWIDILPKLNKKFDGIFHDTHLDENLNYFLYYAKPVCKKNCILSMFSHIGSYNFWDYITIKSDIESFKKLPYFEKPNCTSSKFNSDKYLLRYTTFDGNNFVSKNKTKIF
jgi:hypothetical protein